MENLIKALCYISLILLAATFIFIGRAYYDACEEQKDKSSKLWMEAMECKKELKPYQEAEILYEDGEFKAIKVLK